MAEKEVKVVEAEDKKAKPAKAKKEKKPGKVKNAWKGFVSELKKITWPTWKQVLKNSLIVAVIVVICTAAIWLFDWAFITGFEALVTFIVGLFT